MTETTIYALEPEIQVTVLERTIVSLERLIAKRDIWLNDSKNKSRSTYNSIVADTNEMREKLKEYQERLEETKLKTNK